MIHFGQMPRGAIVALQVPVFALVGALSSITPEPTPPPSFGGGAYREQQQELSLSEHPEELLEVLELLFMNHLI